MELGVYRLAEINAGGGLRQKAVGLAGQYLDGTGAWANMPTSMTPTAHNHSATEITSGQLALARIPTGTTSSTVALGNHTHLYAGSATAGGPAATALALATGRTITLTGAVTGTSAAWTGSDNLSLATTLAGVNVEKIIQNSSYSRSSGISIIDSLRLSYLRASQIAFIPASNIEIEYTDNNGASWYNAGYSAASKASLFACNRSGRVTVGKNDGTEMTVGLGTRITILCSDRYTTLNQCYLWFDRNSNSVTYLTLEGQLNGSSTWNTIFSNKQVDGWPGNNVINFPSIRIQGSNASHYRYLRFTFLIVSFTSNTYATNRPVIGDIRVFGQAPYNFANNYQNYESIYRWDYQQNTFFPNAISPYATGQNLGSSSAKWNLYAGIIHGALFDDNVTLSAESDLTLSKHAGLNRLAYFDASGKVQSDSNTLITSFSKTNHNHDSAYLKLTGGTVTGTITLGSNGKIYKSGWNGNRIAYFVSGELTTSASYTVNSFALAGHTHALSDLPKLDAGTLMVGTGTGSTLGTLARGSNGQFLSVVSNQLAWVAAPSGSTVSPANPTASVGLSAVNGSASTFMRSDAAPKLDVSISPTWTGNHFFSGLTQLANVGIGVAPSTSYKLYVVEDKEITTAGSYIGNYLIAKYNTALTSGTRQGIALLGQLWATGGTLTEAKGLDFKVYVPSGTVTKATAINAVIQTDGGTVGTAYGLKIARQGTAPTVANYGIYQDDSAATNVFNGYCEFNGGTNLVTSGRVRNFRTMSASGTINHVNGTDTLVITTNSTSEAALGLPTTATTGDRIEVYSTTYNAYFTCPSAKILPVQYGPNDSSGLVTSWGSSSGGSLYGIGAPGYFFAIWDGTYWRVGYLNPQY